MTDVLWVMCWTVPIIIAQLIEREQTARRHKAEFDRLCGVAETAQAQLDTERVAWWTERQQLLDRIQAPSFAELKQAEVKIIRAQNGEKESPPLVPL